MGCDIHFTVERKFGDDWVGVYSTDYSPNLVGDRGMEKLSDIYVGEKREYSWEGNVQHHYSRPVLRDRHYEFFAALAGVRGDGPEPNGIPYDASELTRQSDATWGDDGHSWGHMPLEEFVRTWLCVAYPAWYAAARIESNISAIDFMINQILGNYIDGELPLYRVVFWFDN